jgi:TM2 domain-containing membrane protein YozV
MKNQIRIVTILLALVVLAIGCSVEKRHFRDGYFVQWNGKSPTSDHVAAQEVATLVYVSPIVETSPLADEHLPSNVQIGNIEAPSVPVDYLVGSGTKNSSAQVNKRTTEQSAPCDVLIMKSGEEIEAKILEVGEKEIRYRACDNPDGPIMVVSTSRVFKIKYSNGTSQVVNGDDSRVNDDPILGSTSGKSQLVAFVLCFFFGWIGVHRFYLGYTGIAIIQLLTLGGCGVWALIDLIMILTGDLKPRNGDYKDKL